MAAAGQAESGTPANANHVSVSTGIVERLQSANSSERAAALVDLADSNSDDSFELITMSFDDPSVEVRNAAARALYHQHPDLSESFTRALREAPPERRRKIGAAIAGSGLAANAINSLTGEGRDRTYDAFSMLFLMAKAGEVQPLMQAISKHPDHEVRLTAVKLLSLSNQPQILPALRNLAARENLPSDVHTAVMEAIYVLSNKTREVA
jgi:HEAT repeat protein